MPPSEVPDYLQPGACKRAAFFMHGFEMGGAQRMTLTLTRELAAQGMGVDLLIAHRFGPLMEAVPGGIRVIDVGARWLDRLPGAIRRRTRVRAAIPGIVSYLRRERPDVLVGAANHASLAVAWAHALAGRKSTGLVLRATNPLRHPGSSGLKEIAARLSFRWVDHVVAVSNRVALDYQDAVPALDGRATVIPEPVLDEGFAARLAEPPFHPWLTEADNVPLIVTVGRLAVQKDYRTLLHALPLVRREVANARLLIIGDGPERGRLEAVRDELQLGEAVAFAGLVPNPLPALRYAKCFALSSRWEGAGLVLVEALAAGCPVVATDSGGVGWVLDEGRFGTLVPVRDKKQLAAAVVATLRQQHDPEPLRKRARMFESGAVARQYHKLLDEVAVRSSARVKL